MFGSAYASIALRTDEGAALVGCDGDEIVPFGSCEDIVSLGDGLFAAKIEDQYALMDAEGSLLTDPLYEYIRFERDIVCSRINGLWQLLDRQGNALTAAVYTLIVPNGNGGAWAITGTNGDVEPDELLLLDRNGDRKSTGLYVRSIDQTANDGLLCVRFPDSNLCAYCDVYGKIAVLPAFDSASPFKNGLAVVSQSGFCGVIDTDGEFIVAAEYDYADISGNGFIIAQNDAGICVFDDNGVLLSSYEGVSVFAGVIGEHYMILQNDALTVYTSVGDIVHSLPADAFVTEGINSLILSDGAWGEECVYLEGTQQRYQNLYPLGMAQGRPVYAFLQANTARYMNNLLGEIQLSMDMTSHRYGIVGSDGEILLPAVYRSIEYLEDNRFLVRTDNQWRMIDVRGSVLWRKNAEKLS